MKIYSVAFDTDDGLIVELFNNEKDLQFSIDHFVESEWLRLYGDDDNAEIPEDTDDIWQECVNGGSIDSFTVEIKEFTEPEAENQHKPVCTECGSDDVRADAYAAWSPEKAEWYVTQELPNYICEDCEGECSIDWEEVTNERRRNPTIPVSENTG